MKALLERNHTLTELSTKLGMSAPTIKEHANILVSSGIIEQKDEGRKWKYYSLTRKGRDILEARQRQANILIILSCSAVALAGLLLMFSGAMLGANYSSSPATPALGGGQGYPMELPAAGTGPLAAANERALPQIPAAANKTVQGTAATGTVERVEFSCAPAFDVDAVISEEFASNCYSATTEQGCLAVDYFSSASGQFGTGDGEPDCKWGKIAK